MKTSIFLVYYILGYPIGNNCSIEVRVSVVWQKKKKKEKRKRKKSLFHVHLAKNVMRNGGFCFCF